MLRTPAEDIFFAAQWARLSYFGVGVFVVLLVIEVTFYAALSQRHCYALEVRTVGHRPYNLSALPADVDPVVVVVDTHEVMRVNGAPVEAEAVRRTVEGVLYELPAGSRRIIVKASVRVRYQAVVGIIDRLSGLTESPIWLQVDYVEAGHSRRGTGGATTRPN